MNLSLSIFGLFVVMLVALALWRPRYLFGIWPVALLVAPSVRTLIGAAPFYWYDAIILTILLRLYFSRDLRHWPAGVPRWHRWFIGVALVIGTLIPLARYGPSPEALWIFGHASLAWMAFPIGMALYFAPAAEAYRKWFGYGLVISLAAGATIAVLEFGDQAMAAAINGFYFQDMKAHLVLLEGTGARLSAARVNGPHGDPNTFGGTSAVVCALCLLLFSRSSRKLALVALALAAIIIGATVSRQVLVAAAVGFLAAFAFGTVRHRLHILGAVALLAAVAISTGVVDSWGERLSRWEGGIDQDRNVIGRVVIGPKRMITLIEQRPFVLLTGVGLDIQKLAKKIDDKTSIDIVYRRGGASNGFLLPLYSMGVVAFVLTLAFWIAALRRAMRQSKDSRALDIGCVVTAMVLITSDNYSYLVEVTVAMLFMLAAAVTARSIQARARVPLPEPAAVLAPTMTPDISPT